MERRNGCSWITEIVIGGAKSCSYMTDNCKVVIKQKGITLDVANSEVVNFNSMKVFFNDGILQSIPRYQFQWGKATQNITTGKLSRSIHSTINSKPDLDGYDTTPKGYKKRRVS